MYQAIVLGLGFLLLFGGGYLITRMDKEGIIMSNLAGKKTVTTATSTETASSSQQSSVAGTYVCDVDSGCQNPSILMINGEGEVRMTTSYDNGVEVLAESGTWKSEEDNGITVLITGTDADVYPSPRTFFVKYVSSLSLSGITFDASVYKEWTRPVFRKQTKEEE